MSGDRSVRMLQERIPRLLLSFSLPAIVGMLAQAMYNLIDRVFVGHAIGSNGIAGTTVCFPFMTLLMAFGMLISFGSAALVSIRLGEKRHEETEQIIGNAFVLLICVAVTLTTVGSLLLDPLLVLFGASPTVLPFAHDYMRIILLGSIFQTIGFGFNALIRAEGNPRIAMVTMLISVVLNAILAPIFIFGFNGGMKGAALATVVAQFVCAVWVLSYFLRGRSLVRLRWRNMRVRLPVFLAIITIGSPPFAMQIAASVTNSIINHQLLKQGGDIAISVIGIVFAMSMVIGMPIIGINQGAQPIIGYNYGAKRFDRVKKTLQTAIIGASCIALFGFVLAMIFPLQVIRAFNSSDIALASLGVHAIRTAMFLLPLAGFQMVSSSYFQAVGKPRHAMLLTLSRQFLLLIPAVLVLPHFFGLDGVWLAIPFADLASTVWTGHWLMRELRLLNARGDETTKLRAEPASASTL